MANYNVTVECTYTFDVEIMKALSTMALDGVI